MPADREHSAAPGSETDAVLNACARCKHRKKKCDRVRPQCAYCARSNAQCIYDVPSTDGQQKQLIAQLTRENAKLSETSAKSQNRIRELERRMEASSAAIAATRTTFNQNPSPVAINVLPSPISSIAGLSTSPVVSASADASLAEFLVAQAFEAQNDRNNQSLPAFTASSLGLQPEPTNGSRPMVLLPSAVNTSFLPPKDVAERLINHYFEFTNSLHPVVDREMLNADLAAAYPPNPLQQSAFDRLGGPDVRAFRLFMVLAIGTNVMPKADAALDPSLLRACAAAHFPAALRTDTTTSMQCIVLYCLISMTDSASMDPFQNVRRTAQLAMHLGLNREDPSMPWAVRNARRRIFWCIFCMDRSICFTLVRPVGIPEDSIAVPLPSSVPELSVTSTRFLRPSALFHQIVLLRRLQGLIATELSSSASGGSQPFIINTRNLIDSWYAGVPRSSDGQVHPYLEVNYHLLLVKLYTPSLSTPHTNASDMITLRESAFAVIQMYSAGKHEHRIAQNHVTMAHIVASCLALVYVLLESDGASVNLQLVSWRQRAMQQLLSAEELLQTFCVHSPHAARYSVAFTQYAADVKNRLRSAEVDIPQPNWARVQDDEAQTPSVQPTVGVGQPSFNFANQPGAFMPGPGLSQANGNGQGQVVVPGADPFVLPWDLVLDGTANMPSNGSNDIDFTGNGADIDDLLASFGIGAFQA